MSARLGQSDSCLWKERVVVVRRFRGTLHHHEPASQRKCNYSAASPRNTHFPKYHPFLPIHPRITNPTQPPPPPSRRIPKASACPPTVVDSTSDPPKHDYPSNPSLTSQDPDLGHTDSNTIRPALCGIAAIPRVVDASIVFIGARQAHEAPAGAATTTGSARRHLSR